MSGDLGKEESKVLMEMLRTVRIGIVIILGMKWVLKRY